MERSGEVRFGEVWFGRLGKTIINTKNSIMKKEYKWKLKGIGKKIDADKAVQELQRITDVYGKLTPEVIVSEAKSKTSPLHSFFQWDNKLAAEQWRMQQARIMINNIEVTYISDGEPKVIPVYEIVNKEDGYRHIETFTVDEIKVLKDNAIRDLKYIQNKLKAYDSFIKAEQSIQYAINELQEV